MNDKNTDDLVKDTVDKYEQYDSSPQKKQKKIRSTLFVYLRIIIIALGISFFLMTFVIMNARVPTGSMKDTINEKDRIIGLRAAYWFNSPKRGDVVVFKFPDDESKKYVKRVIGLPGDTVSFADGEVYVNGEKLDEPYVREQGVTYSYNQDSYTVPDDSYFMLGDNRTNSKDARLWNNTFVHKKKILAKVMFRYYNGETKRLNFSGVK